MLDTPDHSDILARDKALTLAALAATSWCARGSAAVPTGGTLVERAMLAASWASRARRSYGLPALSPADLLACLEQPVSDWLPDGGAFNLVEGGQPTPICQDLADDAGTSPLAEIEQRIIRDVMRHLLGRADGAAAYTAFRRFLVEHAHAESSAAAAAAQSVGVEFAQVYSHIAPAAVIARGKQSEFYPCPRCRWPMHVHGTLVSCHRSETCLAAGARFDLSEASLVGLGALPPPSPVLAQGKAALRPGIWRFTVLPGLEELDLERRLAAIDGATVMLWPFVDAYDLDVRRGEARWRIDVKDHSSAVSLARHLNDRQVTETTWIVVPDRREAQIPVLERLVARDAGYRFASSSEIVRRVKEAA